MYSALNIWQETGGAYCVYDDRGEYGCSNCLSVDWVTGWARHWVVIWLEESTDDREDDDREDGDHNARAELDAVGLIELIDERA